MWGPTWSWHNLARGKENVLHMPLVNWKKNFSPLAEGAPTPGSASVWCIDTQKTALSLTCCSVASVFTATQWSPGWGSGSWSSCIVATKRSTKGIDQLPSEEAPFLLVGGGAQQLIACTSNWHKFNVLGGQGAGRAFGEPQSPTAPGIAFLLSQSNKKKPLYLRNVSKS